MAIARAKELRQKSEEELRKMLAEYRAELRRIKAQTAAGVRPENPGRARELKRTIARILTILREKKG
ncbi:MAG: large subunit ribosomal protein [Candidatus Diapherotrites archaeon]|nr:large subunit ribosomal protein [Candidatus Diapherotrites archaeon]MDN5366927.1 large subunit ribosomal protein [Candidatus Diapherotrites archaeon]